MFSQAGTSLRTAAFLRKLCSQNALIMDSPKKKGHRTKPDKAIASKILKCDSNLAFALGRNIHPIAFEHNALNGRKMTHFP
jgi:hypothetical protein